MASRLCDFSSSVPFGMEKTAAHLVEGLSIAVYYTRQLTSGSSPLSMMYSITSQLSLYFFPSTVNLATIVVRAVPAGRTQRSGWNHRRVLESPDQDIG